MNVNDTHPDATGLEQLQQLLVSGKEPRLARRSSFA